jgi:hypothetical protein
VVLVFALLKAVLLAAYREVRTLNSIQGNNFFFFALLLSMQPESMAFIWTVLGLVMMVPALAAPLAKIPEIRLKLLPLEAWQARVLRPFTKPETQASPWLAGAGVEADCEDARLLAGGGVVDCGHGVPGVLRPTEPGCVSGTFDDDCAVSQHTGAELVWTGWAGREAAVEAFAGAGLSDFVEEGWSSGWACCAADGGIESGGRAGGDVGGAGDRASLQRVVADRRGGVAICDGTVFSLWITASNRDV